MTYVGENGVNFCIFFFPPCLPQSLIFEVGVRCENRSQSKPARAVFLMVGMASAVDAGFLCV